MEPRECLYDVQWQELRMSFLGKWKDDEGTWENLIQLYRYVGEALHQDETEMLFRCYRAWNMLDAIITYRTHKGSHEDELAAHRRIYRTYLDGNSDEWSSLTWDWDKVRREVSTQLSAKDRRSLRLNIQNRKHHSKAEEKFLQILMAAPASKH